MDVVVNAAGLEDPALAALITGHGVAFVDITATTGYVAALERLDPPPARAPQRWARPGLTNLLAAAVHTAAWSYGLLGRRFRDPGTGEPVRNYSRPQRFDLPGWGRRRLYRAGGPADGSSPTPTAMLAATAARAAVGLPPGVHHLHRVLTLDRHPHGSRISLWEHA
jgi:hypothetical protein